MGAPISRSPESPGKEDYQRPESGRKRKAEPKGSAKRLKQATEEEFEAATRTPIASTSRPPIASQRTVTRSMTRAQADTAKSAEEVRRGRKRGADSDMAVSAAKEAKPALSENLLSLSPVALQALLDTLPQNIDADIIQKWVDSLDDDELTKRPDLNVFEALFIKTGQTAGLEKVTAAKNRRIENAEKIFEELKLDHPRAAVIKALCQSGADLSIQREIPGVGAGPGPALVLAAYKNVTEVVKILVEATTDAQVRFSALLMAAMNGNNELMQTLVGMGVDSNYKSPLDGGSVLLTCCRMSVDLEVIKTLIGLGANVKHADDKGLTALHHTARSLSHKGFVERCFPQLKANIDQAKTIEFLLQSGLDINVADKEGKTALHHAVEAGDTRMCETLIRFGADVNLADKNGQTALSSAIGAWELNIIEVLVDAGADLKQVSETGATALHIASEKNAVALIEKLVKLGIDINRLDKDGRPALEHALSRSSDEAIKALIRLGADVNVPDAHGKTMLHRAAQGFSRNRIYDLVQLGADINRQDTSGKTALHYACQAGKRDFIELIASFERVDSNLVDKEGKTAFDYALEAFDETEGSTRTIMTYLECFRDVINDHARESINSSRLNLSILIYHERERLGWTFSSEVKKLLETLIIKTYQLQWQADQSQLPSHHFYFYQDPSNPNRYQVRTGRFSGFIEKERFFQIVLVSLNEEHIERRLTYHLVPAAEVSTISPSTTSNYSLTLHQTELHEHPEKILATLNELFTQARASTLYITFAGEEGIDAGGLRRQFVSRLFSELCEKMKFEKCENKLFRPILQQDSEGNFLPLTDVEKATYHHLGNLIMFCLNASESYPTGMVLDQGVLDAMRFMPKDTYTPDELFAIFERLASYNESDIQLVERFKKYLAMPDDATLQEMAQVIGIDEDIATMKSHLPEIVAALQKYMHDNIFMPRLAPLHEIAVGMRLSPFRDRIDFEKVQQQHPAELSRWLQGTVSKQDIIEKLEFSETAPAHVQDFLKGWIQGADEEKLRLFLFAVSGSSALGAGARIKIANGSSIAFHTCGFQIDLDYENIATESDLAERLDVALHVIKADPRFDAR